MKEISNGGTAFPTVNYTRPGGVGMSIMTVEGGMSLRDYFAAKAMQGEMANPEAKFNAEQRANWAYEVADAMLKARGES